jgi:hypothetical protein
VVVFAASALISSVSASPARPAYVPLNVTPAITLKAGQLRTFTSAAAPTGTVIACLTHGLRSEMKVPPVTRAGAQAVGVIAWKKGGASTHINIERHSLNLIVATCN